MTRTDIIPQQKFKLAGTIYISAPAKNGCWGCVFKDDTDKCFKSPPCTWHQRDDRTSVIYIKETK